MILCGLVPTEDWYSAWSTLPTTLTGWKTAWDTLKMITSFLTVQVCQPLENAVCPEAVMACPRRDCTEGAWASAMELRVPWQTSKRHAVVNICGRDSQKEHRLFCRSVQEATETAVQAEG